MKKISLGLLLLVFTVLFSACDPKYFHVEEKPEDKVVELETQSEAPISKMQDFKIDDDVSVIRSDGTFEDECQIDRISSGKIVFAVTYDRGHPSAKAWMQVEDAVHLKGDEKSFPKGYYVRIGTFKNTRYEWIPPAQVFPAPWANAVNLKVGDTVFEKRFGNFEFKKGVITELPSIKGGRFSVRFDSYDRDDWVEWEDIYSSIEPAAVEKLSAGDIVYYDRMHWAMIVGKKDDHHVIIRETGFAARDKIVDISKIQVMR